MAKMVGLNVSLKMGWIKKAVELLSHNLTEEEYKNELREHLSFEIDSPTNLRKAKDNLTFIWYRNGEENAVLQEEGRRLVLKYPDDITAISWCMIPLAYPVFYDLARLMGKLFEFQETVTTGQIRQKIFDEWGERSTLDYSTGKIIAAMKALEAVSSPGTGKYIASSIPVKNEEVVSFLIKTAMHFSGSSYYSFSTLNDFPFLFPFDYKVTKEQLMNDKQFVLSVFDSTLSVGLKK